MRFRACFFIYTTTFLSLWLLSVPILALRVVLPMRYGLGLDAEWPVRHRSQVMEVMQKMTESWIGEGRFQNLELFDAVNLSANQRSLLGKLQVEKNSLASEEFLALAPSVYRFTNRVVAFLEVWDGDRMSILSSRHWVVDSLDQPEWIQKAAEIAAQMKEIRPREHDHRHQLQIRGLSLGLESDLLHSELLSHLMAAQFVQRGQPVLVTSGNELLVTLVRALKRKKRPFRATRTWLFEWRFGKSPLKDVQIEGGVNLEFDFRTREAEGVFSQSVQTQEQSGGKQGFRKMGLKTAEGSENLEISYPEDLNRQIEVRNQALSSQSLPQVAHIYGAWAYLDKGRAWGLQLGDRLVVQSSQGAIKGHIVRYFGVQEKIKSVQGYLIEEGAIMYVRKGQRKIQLGDRLDYDRRSYPTPWPPKPDMN